MEQTTNSNNPNLSDDLINFTHEVDKIADAFKNTTRAVRGVAEALRPITIAMEEAERLERERKVLLFNRFWFGLSYSDKCRLNEY